MLLSHITLFFYRKIIKHQRWNDSFEILKGPYMRQASISTN